MTPELPHTPTVCVGDPATTGLCVVVLHGYAMEPEELQPFARSMAVPGLYCFPRGPWPAVPRGRAWWPIDSAARSASLAAGARDLADEHPVERHTARAALAQLLRKPPLPQTRRLVLAGFSQGGMLACDTLVHEQVQVDGLALFSSSRIAFDEWLRRQPRISGLPVMVSHGTLDGDLSFSAGRALHDWLEKAGAHTRWVPFEGGHEIPLPVWREFRKFLRETAEPGRALAPLRGPFE